MIKLFKKLFTKQYPKIYIAGQLHEWNDAMHKIHEMEYIFNEVKKHNLIYFDYETRRYEVVK